MTETKQTYQQLEQELEVWRHGPSCWSCGDSGDVHHLDGEWLGKCDCLAAQLIEVKAENERLKGLQPGYPPRPPDGEGLPRYGLRWNGPQQPLAVPITDGYWTPWHLADQLKADSEALRKDLESHKRMLLSAAVSIGTIGEALGAEMDDDPSELEGLAAELRKDADRFRFVIDCPIRTMVALSRKSTEADFDLSAECDQIMSKIASKKTGD